MNYEILSCFSCVDEIEREKRFPPHCYYEMWVRTLEVLYASNRLRSHCSICSSMLQMQMTVVGALAGHRGICIGAGISLAQVIAIEGL
jgi:hypothetical protein